MNIPVRFYLLRDSVPSHVSSPIVSSLLAPAAGGGCDPGGGRSSGASVGAHGSSATSGTRGSPGGSGHNHGSGSSWTCSTRPSPATLSRRPCPRLLLSWLWRDKVCRLRRGIGGGRVLSRVSSAGRRRAPPLGKLHWGVDELHHNTGSSSGVRGGVQERPLLRWATVGAALAVAPPHANPPARIISRSGPNLACL
jgi:hypothetical protein